MSVPIAGRDAWRSSPVYQRAYPSAKALFRSTLPGLREPDGHEGDDAGDGGSPIEPAKRGRARGPELSAGEEPETAKRCDGDEDQCQCPSQDETHGGPLRCISELIPAPRSVATHGPIATTAAGSWRRGCCLPTRRTRTGHPGRSARRSMGWTSASKPRSWRGRVYSPDDFHDGTGRTPTNRVVDFTRIARE